VRIGTIRERGARAERDEDAIYRRLGLRTARDGERVVVESAAEERLLGRLAEIDAGRADVRAALVFAARRRARLGLGQVRRPRLLARVAERGEVPVEDRRRR